MQYLYALSIVTIEYKCIVSKNLSERNIQLGNCKSICSSISQNIEKNKDNLRKPLIKRMLYSYTGNPLQAAAPNGPNQSPPSSVHYLKTKRRKRV